MPKKRPQEDKNRIQLRREELNLTIEEISDMGDIAIPTLYAIEGSKNVKLNSAYLVRLGNVLKISPDYLVGLTDEKQVLDSPIFECDIHKRIVDKVRKGYLKEGQSLLEFNEQHPNLPVIYSANWRKKNANYDSLLKFVNFFHCSLTDLIALSTKEKLQQLEDERNKFDKLVEYFN